MPVKADKRLILVAGQSNCVGKGDASLSIGVMPGIAFEYTYIGDRLKPLLDPVGVDELHFQQAETGSAWPAFAQTINRLTGDTIIIVAAARGGSSNHEKAELEGMGTWATGGKMPLFEDAVKKVKAAMKKTGLPLSAVVWVQGERDANAINSGELSPAAYENSLRGLIERFRSALQANTPFFLVKTGYYSQHSKTGFDLVRAAQTKVAQSLDQVYIAFEKTNTFPERQLMVDAIHYNQQALNELGEAVAVNLVRTLHLPQQTKVEPSFRINGITEFQVRGGLPHFCRKSLNGDTVRVAYIGGSITQLDERYRRQATNLIRQQFPKARLVEIAAGIPGTDADLGACRVKEQVLIHHPDLVFIEFAVNGGFPQGVEGIIRQVKQANNQTDICLLYAATADQLNSYVQGKLLPHIQQLEVLADHYQIPSVHLALYPGWMLAQQKLTAKGSEKTKADKVVFTADGVHPLKQGGNLYAAAIARLLKQVVVAEAHHSMHSLSSLPPAQYADNWEDASWVNPEGNVRFSEAWAPVPMQDSLKQFAPWFSQAMAAEQVGASGTIRFEGDAVGLFDIGGPEVGQLRLSLDGKEISVVPDGGVRYRIAEGGSPIINRFNAYCNNRYRGQFFILQVPKGKHELTFRIDKQIPDKRKILGEQQQDDINRHLAKYAHTKIYIGKILVKGKIR
ncbi:hypothetical protein GCM10023231_03400 [Olivibacter ginsenosidimutans]|uniref:Sialate O-acetylesterase domain-containing protein n=2 Tax=Olivibacter ginsenosidimutans TaxID=1176537 RepID=A0ABP9AED1_9SPHI